MDLKSLTGRLVVATTSLVDPNFHLSAALILEHGEHGALGVVLNRPSEMAVEDVLPAWSAAVSEPRVVFHGGPVQPSTVIAVARCRVPVLSGWRQIRGAIGVIDLDADPAVVVPDLSGLRVFAGYAGWGSAQLETEIASGAWFVIDAAVDDPFYSEPAQLWHRVLHRQGGLFTTVATDPTLN